MVKNADSQVPEAGVSEEPDTDHRGQDGGRSGIRDDSVLHVRKHSGKTQREGGGSGEGKDSAGAHSGGDAAGAAESGKKEDLRLEIPDYPWEDLSIERAEQLQSLRAETQKGATIIQQRISNSKELERCTNPDCNRPIRGAAFFTRQPYRDKNFNLQIAIACSEKCWVKVSEIVGRPVQVSRGSMVRT
jgi:hypothetical protein